MIEDLDSLSSKELHDRAFAHALRHADVRFFIRLVKALPAAHAAVGEIDEAEDDVLRPSAAIADAVTDDPQTADLLRPLYLDYLARHQG